MDARSLKLPKAGRIYRRGEIDALFASGDSFTVWPVRCVYMAGEGRAVMVSAPKRSFKRAVVRNLLKRRIREAYRLHQHRLEGVGVRLALHYVGKEVVAYAQIEQAVVAILDRLAVADRA